MMNSLVADVQTRCVASPAPMTELGRVDDVALT
jgi:hypothetical protein